MEVGPHNEVLALVVAQGLGPERGSQIVLEISNELRDIEIAFEALDVVTIRKVPNFEFALKGPVALHRRQRFSARVQQRGDDGTDRTSDPTPKQRGHDIEPPSDVMSRSRDPRVHLRKSTPHVKPREQDLSPKVD
eukprot:6974740-Pyramimonas_sp.AAC.1